MRTDLAHALAGAFLSCDWSRPALIEVGSVVIGRRSPWLPALVEQVLAVYRAPPLDRPRELADVVVTRPAAARAGRTRPIARLPAPTCMVTNPWHLPVLHEVRDVARLVNLTEPELAWFADLRRWARESTEDALRHYTATTRSCSTGAVRVLETPKRRLKQLQRRLHAELVGQIPPHEAAHGFRAGRSVATFAAPHAGQAVVARLDLEGFFASVTVARVYGILRTVGYPEPVAHCLTGLTTTVLPLRAWQAITRPSDPRLLDAHWRLGRRLATPHLPQGAPTSPALANLAAYRLDTRLTGLAASWGWRYTRYADDLALSARHHHGRGAARLLNLVEQVVVEEGFRLNDRKTAVLPRARKQVLGGLVINERAHVSRAEVDTLRAILHNCVRHGPSTQNRDNLPNFRQHLAGRVAWVAQHDASRGARLRAQFDAIDWTR